MLIEPESPDPGVVILDSSWYYGQYYQILTSNDLGVSHKDTDEIIWQVLAQLNQLERLEEEHVISVLRPLPSFQTLTCTQVLDDEEKERKFKETIMEFGLRLYREAKMLGLFIYNPTPISAKYELPYYLLAIHYGRLILKRLRN